MSAEQSEGIPPNYEPETDSPNYPGVDPRMSKEYRDSIMRPKTMHTQFKSTLDQPATDIVNNSSLANLIDRLEHVHSHAAAMQGTITGLNDRLAGSIPQEAVGGKATGDKPDGYLSYAHSLVYDIEAKLYRIEAEFKRLNINIGD